MFGGAARTVPGVYELVSAGAKYYPHNVPLPLQAYDYETPSEGVLERNPYKPGIAL